MFFLGIEVEKELNLAVITLDSGTPRKGSSGALETTLFRNVKSSLTG